MAMSSPSLLELIKNDAAVIGSPVLSSSPVSEILSPRPIRRVSFNALVRLAAAFEPAAVTTTTAIIATLATSTSAVDRNRELLSGSKPEYGSWGGGFGVIGGERKGKGVGVIGGERGLRK